MACRNERAPPQQNPTTPYFGSAAGNPIPYLATASSERLIASGVREPSTARTESTGQSLKRFWFPRFMVSRSTAIPMKPSAASWSATERDQAVMPRLS